MLFAHFLAVGLLAGLGGVYHVLAPPVEVCIYPASVLLTLIIGWAFWSWRLAGRSWLEPYGLFLLSACLFNGGQAVLEILRLNQGGLLNGRFSDPVVLGALYLVSLGLAALHLGALAAAAGQRRCGESQEPVPGGAAALQKIGLLCLGVSLAPVGMVLRDALSVVNQHGYDGLFGRQDQAQLPSVVQALAALSVPGILFLLGGGRRKPLVRAAVILLLAVYSGILLFVGSRGPAVMPLVAALWLYHRAVHRIPGTVSVALGLALLLALPIIAGVRGMAGEWRATGEWLASIPEDAGELAIRGLSELGGTLAISAHTLQLVPAGRPYDYGLSYLYALATMVPNLGWQVHPAVARGLWADWLVRTVDPSRAAKGGGMGFSFLAEAYANFGWYGYGFALAALGYLLVRFFMWGERGSDVVRLAMVASVLSVILLYARGESGALVRPVVWYALAPYAAARVVQRRQVKRWVREMRARAAWLKTLEAACCARGQGGGWT